MLWSPEIYSWSEDGQAMVIADEGYLQADNLTIAEFAKELSSILGVSVYASVKSKEIHDWNLTFLDRHELKKNLEEEYGVLLIEHVGQVKKYALSFEIDRFKPFSALKFGEI